MEQHKTIRCLNCGTEWISETPPHISHERATLGDICPVCHFRNSATAIPPSSSLSADDLASRLAALIAEAQASGLAPDRIVQVLRDELEFAAELAAPGRQVCVQVIDLGPRDTNILYIPRPSQRQPVQRRTA